MGRRKVKGILAEFECLVEQELNTGCWLWLGAVRATKYGVKQWPLNGVARTVPAHKLSWFLYRGNGIWPKEHVLHHCDTPACVNPNHLFLGNAKMNAQDRVRKNRSNQGALSFADAEIIRASSASASDLALSYGVWPQTIYAIRAGKIWKQELHPGAKLNPSAVTLIRTSQEKHAVLARQFGVSVSIIKAVRKRRIWKKVA